MLTYLSHEAETATRFAMVLQQELRRMQAAVEDELRRLRRPRPPEEWLRQQVEELAPPAPPPRYDDVFFEGQAWLDGLASEPHAAVEDEPGGADPAGPGGASEGDSDATEEDGAYVHTFAEGVEAIASTITEEDISKADLRCNGYAPVAEVVEACVRAVEKTFKRESMEHTIYGTDDVEPKWRKLIAEVRAVAGADYGWRDKADDWEIEAVRIRRGAWVNQSKEEAQQVIPAVITYDPLSFAKKRPCDRDGFAAPWPTRKEGT